MHGSSIHARSVARLMHRKLVDQSWRQSMKSEISLGLGLDQVNGVNDLDLFMKVQELCIIVL